MKVLVEVGSVSRPHGFRGELVVASSSGKDSALGYVKTLFIGRTEKEASPFAVLSSDWMPRGWKMKLEGISSDTDAKKLVGSTVFADRADLAELEPNEFYVGDLVGAEVLDADTNERVGVFMGVESTRAHDRWWVERENGEEIGVPATKAFVVSVDSKNRVISIRRWQELL